MNHRISLNLYFLVMEWQLTSVTECRDFPQHFESNIYSHKEQYNFEIQICLEPLIGYECWWSYSSHSFIVQYHISFLTLCLFLIFLYFLLKSQGCSINWRLAKNIQLAFLFGVTIVILTRLVRIVTNLRSAWFARLANHRKQIQRNSMLHVVTCCCQPIYFIYDWD